MKTIVINEKQLNLLINRKENGIYLKDLDKQLYFYYNRITGKKIEKLDDKIIKIEVKKGLKKVKYF